MKKETEKPKRTWNPKESVELTLLSVYLEMRRNPKLKLYAFAKKTGLNPLVITIAVSQGIITKQGQRRSTTYQWAAGNPDEKMFLQVLEIYKKQNLQSYQRQQAVKKTKPREDVANTAVLQQELSSQGKIYFPNPNQTQIETKLDTLLKRQSKTNFMLSRICEELKIDTAHWSDKETDLLKELTVKDVRKNS